MSRLIYIAIVVAIASSSVAYHMAPLDMVQKESALVVVGRTLSIADAGQREIRFPGLESESWFFAHSVARAVVQEVVHCPGGFRVSAGDTIDIYYATSDSATRPGAVRPSASVEDVVMRGLPIAGETAAYGMFMVDGALRFACRLSASELAQYRSSVQTSTARGAGDKYVN